MPDDATRVDWATRLRGLSVDDIAKALSTLPNDVQQRVEPAFEGVTAGSKPVPWDMASASVAAVLHELDLHTLYKETLVDEYGYETVGQLAALGTGEAWDVAMRELGVTQDHRHRIQQLAFSQRPLGTCSTCFSGAFLDAIRPAWAATMGCENMGVLLYALTRFVKPRAVLEVGAGITSIWLLQALRDNHEELTRCAAAQRDDWNGYRVGAPPPGAEWMVEDELYGRAAVAPVLHCVDNMAHTHTTAHKVKEAAEELGLTAHLRLHEADAYTLAEEWEEREGATGTAVDVADGVEADGVSAGGAGCAGGAGGAGAAAAAGGEGGEGGAGAAGSKPAPLELIWLDFGIGVGGRLDEFLNAWWPRLAPGGWLVVHSTLTNAVTRHWLEKMRARVGVAAPADGAGGDALGYDFRELSFREPHKRFQNSCSWFQKRSDGWAEPLFTQYP